MKEGAVSQYLGTSGNHTQQDLGNGHDFRLTHDANVDKVPEGGIIAHQECASSNTVTDDNPGPGLQEPVIRQRQIPGFPLAG